MGCLNTCIYKKNKEIFYSTSIVVSKDISWYYFEINVDIKSLWTVVLCNCEDKSKCEKFLPLVDAYS